MKSTDLNMCRRRAAFGASAGLLFVLIAAMAIAAAGCNGAGATSPPASDGNKDGDKKQDAGKNDKKEARTAKQILDDLQAAYRNQRRPIIRGDGDVVGMPPLEALPPGPRCGEADTWRHLHFQTEA